MFIWGETAYCETASLWTLEVSNLATECSIRAVSHRTIVIPVLVHPFCVYEVPSTRSIQLYGFDFPRDVLEVRGVLLGGGPGNSVTGRSNTIFISELGEIKRWSNKVVYGRGPPTINSSSVRNEGKNVWGCSVDKRGCVLRGPYRAEHLQRTLFEGVDLSTW